MLETLIKDIDAESDAPLEKWNPPFCGDIDMEIRPDGQWFYGGTPIGRERLVRLFARILWRDETGKYYLKTPVELVGIRVEDAPFVATSVDVVPGEMEFDQNLVFTTNVQDRVILGADHALRVEHCGKTGTPRPYIHIRRDLWALISRPVFYELVHMAEEEDGALWIHSGSSRFCLGRFEE